MDVRTIGTSVRIGDVNFGKCIIFNFHSIAQIGIIVATNQNESGILHFDATIEGVAFPTIYELNHSYNEKCIVIGSDRIVSVLAPEHIGFGRFTRSVSQALYITDESAIIVAAKNHSAPPINLLTGAPGYMDSAGPIYTKAWYIEVIDADGSYEPYYEFRCEPTA